MKKPHFKAWHKEKQQLFDVTSIDFLENTIQISLDGRHSNKMPLNDFELWPYTGYEDINGTPIYENFIYREKLIGYMYTPNDYTYGIVEWNDTIIENDPFSEDEPVDEAYYTGYLFNPRLTEVIGNKYENKDLLKRY